VRLTTTDCAKASTGTGGDIEASPTRTTMKGHAGRMPLPARTTIERSSGSIDPTCEQRWVRWRYRWRWMGGSGLVWGAKFVRHGIGEPFAKWLWM